MKSFFARWSSRCVSLSVATLCVIVISGLLLHRLVLEEKPWVGWVFLPLAALCVVSAAFGLWSEKWLLKSYAAGILLLCFWGVLSPSGPPMEKIPAGVKVAGLDRVEAEFLYAHIHHYLRSLYWEGLKKGDLRGSWKRIHDWRYSIESLTKNPDGSVSIIVAHKWQGRPVVRQDYKTTGSWPGQPKTKEH